jgi:hypothetical protein
VGDLGFCSMMCYAIRNTHHVFRIAYSVTAENKFAPLPSSPTLRLPSIAPSLIRR